MPPPPMRANAEAFFPGAQIIDDATQNHMPLLIQSLEALVHSQNCFIAALVSELEVARCGNPAASGGDTSDINTRLDSLEEKPLSVNATSCGDWAVWHERLDTLEAKLSLAEPAHFLEFSDRLTLVESSYLSANDAKSILNVCKQTITEVSASSHSLVEKAITDKLDDLYSFLDAKNRCLHGAVALLSDRMAVAETRLESMVGSSMDSPHSKIQSSQALSSAQISGILLCDTPEEYMNIVNKSCHNQGRSNRKLCKFFARGYCKHDSECSFAHADNHEIPHVDNHDSDEDTLKFWEAMHSHLIKTPAQKDWCCFENPRLSHP